MLAQEKVPKEKGPRSTHRVESTRPLRSLARAFLANPGAAHNSCISLRSIHSNRARGYSPD
ncbi:MAG: hypothetical protein WBN90_01395, partial [Gammaproteobacteria bacterium]